MTPQSRAVEIIAKVAEDYRRRGYQVDVAPDGPSVPEFLGDFRPDLTLERRPRTDQPTRHPGLLLSPCLGQEFLAKATESLHIDARLRGNTVSELVSNRKEPHERLELLCADLPGRVELSDDGR